MYKILLLATMFLVLLSATAQEIKALLDSAKIAEYREKIAIDYSKPDFSITKINVKVMGSRLAKIVERLCNDYGQQAYIPYLNHIQAKLIDGLTYARIRKLKLNRVYKSGNFIGIILDTTLEENNLNLKK